MTMEFSARIKKEAKHYNTRPDWLVMADLRSIGYTDAEAYSIVHQEYAAMSQRSEIALRSRIVDSLDYKNLVADRRKLLASGKAVAAGDDIDLISSEQVAKEVLRTALTQPDGSKERADLLIKYADLTSKNTDINSDEDDGVGIYVPLKCYLCPLMEAYLERVKKDEENGKEESGEDVVREVAEKESEKPKEK